MIVIVISMFPSNTILENESNQRKWKSNYAYKTGHIYVVGFPNNFRVMH